MGLSDTQVTSPKMTHSCCAAFCWSLEAFGIRRWILERINVSDVLREDAVGTDQAGCVLSMGCSLRKAIAEILSRRERRSWDQAKASSTVQLVGRDDYVELDDVSRRVKQSVETATVFVCDEVARALVATSTTWPLDSFSDVESTANRVRGGIEEARLNGCQLIVREDVGHSDSRADGDIWRLDKEIGAEVLRKCLEIPGEDCHDRNKVVLSSFAEGVSCGVHSDNFAVQTPDELGTKFGSQGEEGSFGSGSSWSRSCGEECRPGKEEYFLEPALASPKGLDPQPSPESQPPCRTGTRNFDRGPRVGTTSCKPDGLVQVDTHESKELALAQSEEDLVASALPTSEVQQASFNMGFVDWGIMTGPSDKFLDSTRNESMHGHKTRGEAMDSGRSCLPRASGPEVP